MCSQNTLASIAESAAAIGSRPLPAARSSSPSSRKNATSSRIDLAPPARISSRSRGPSWARVVGADQRDEVVERRRQVLRDEAERDRDLGVRSLAGLRQRGRPGILMAIDHHEADLARVVAEGGERTEEHGAVASDQQRTPFTRQRVRDPCAHRTDHVPKRGLVQQARVGRAHRSAAGGPGRRRRRRHVHRVRGRARACA